MTSRRITLGLVLFMGLFFAWKTRAQAVEHAPTIEQCQADQRLWLDKLEGPSENMPEHYVTLYGWLNEMLQCDSVDPENQRHYQNVMAETHATQVLRLEHFLDRHGLYDKFIAEDKSGKR